MHHTQNSNQTYDKVLKTIIWIFTIAVCTTWSKIFLTGLFLLVIRWNLNILNSFQWSFSSLYDPQRCKIDFCFFLNTSSYPWTHSGIFETILTLLFILWVAECLSLFIRKCFHLFYRYYISNLQFSCSTIIIYSKYFTIFR